MILTSHNHTLRNVIMKKPELRQLADLTPSDEFTKTAQIEKEKASVIIRKTFSLQQIDYDYINNEALVMSQELNRVVSASEALRNIIQRDKGTKR